MRAPRFTRNQAVRRARKRIKAVPDPALNKVCSGLRAELDCAGAFVTFITTKRAFMVGAVGMPDVDPDGTLLNNSFCYHLLANESDGLVADDVSNVPMLQLCPTTAIYGAWVGVPLCFEDMRIGAVGVVEAEPRHWPSNALGVVQRAGALTEQVLLGKDSERV